MRNFILVFTLLSGILLLAFTIQKRTITGVVLDEAKKPLQGATVQLKGTQEATITDKEGKFSISVQNNSSILIVTAVGFQQKEIKVGSKTHFSIMLSFVSDREIDEIVVVGYGKKQKKEITGAVANIDRNYAAPAMRIRGASLTHNYITKDDWRNNDNFNREGYSALKENPFLKATDNPLSTFSIDVDGASYSNIRRFLNNGQLPPDGSVRIEEMINYFTYDYPQPKNDEPFSINTVYTNAPWNKEHQLVSIGLQGKKIATDKLPPSNLVFLIDVSGSMESNDKLPLVQASMKLLTDQLREKDKISIVVYAGSAGLVLPATDGNSKITIKDAIDKLSAGGSTAGGAGIELAYKIAQDNFIKNGNNRVILCTDGDFNVGASSDAAMEKLIEDKRESGVFLTVLGYGQGNYQDAKMQLLADKGNGNHAYIDNLSEAKKVLISQFGGTMFTIAKDVKLLVEFNPAKVQGYRLIGYENRMLNKEDFNDDKKDAGELGSGHTVTALYEIIPVGANAPELKTVDGLKYQKPAPANYVAGSNEILTVKFRYKKPDGHKSLLLQQSITGTPVAFASAGNNIHLSAAVAHFGMELLQSPYKGNAGFQFSENTLADIKDDSGGYVKELLSLIKKAASLQATNVRQVPANELSMLKE